ncbi:MAG: serine hydrolase [Bacillota bacterium]
MNLEQQTAKEFINGGLPRSAPEAQGVPSKAIADYIDALRKLKLNVHSLMVLRNGYVVAEGWWNPYKPEYPHEMASLSKSFTSTAIGIAVDKKMLTVEDKVVDYFSEYAALATDENWQNLQVKHLLTMTNGHAAAADSGRGDSVDWAKSFFEQKFANRPGEVFCYDSIASYMLSRIVAKVTGMDMFEWLQLNLFTPLGITGVNSAKCPHGYSIGGWGMYLKTVDVAKLGLLYLQQGMWQGQQLLSKEWVAQATAAQSDTPDGLGYGYQFWRSPHNAYNGNGMYGQFCLVVPDEQLIVAITAGSGDMHEIVNQVWPTLYAGLSTAPLALDRLACAALRRKLARLGYLPCRNKIDKAELNQLLDGSGYSLAGDSLLQLKIIDFKLMADGVVVGFVGGVKRNEIIFGYGNWNKYDGHGGLQEFGEHDGIGTKVAASAGWLTANELRLSMQHYESFFLVDFTCKFAGDSITISGKTSISFPGSSFELSGQLKVV